MDEPTLPDPEPPQRPRANVDLPRMRLGRYVDFERIGKGGMGVVYLTRDTELGRRVAMKVVRPPADPTEPLPESPTRLTTPDTQGPVAETYAELKARFLREATVTGGMEHPGIVPVYELGETEQGVPYYTMRFVRGNRTMRAALVGRPSFSRRIALLESWLKVVDTLAYAHARGVIHRDLKPDNVALGEYGEVIVLDWGLAKVKGRPDEAVEALREDSLEITAKHRTVPGAIGTPGFMSPEAARGDIKAVDQRSDVYSLGVMLFEILTGRLAQDISNLGIYMTELLHGDPPRADAIDADVPTDLADICAQALARDPEQRVQSAAELAARIRFWEYSTQLEREIAQRFTEAEAALDAAEGLTGSAMLAPLDRAVGAFTRAREVLPEDPRVPTLAARITALRKRSQGERDIEARRRLLRRVALGSLLVLVAAAVVVVLLVDAERREAVHQRQRADAAAVEATLAGRETERSLARSFAVTARRYVNERRGAAAALAAARSLELDESTDAWVALTNALRILPPRSAPLSVGMAVHTLAFDDSGTRLAAGGEYGLVRIWDVKTGRTLNEISTRGRSIRFVRFMDAGARLLTGNEDGTLRLFDIAAARVDQTLVGPEDPINAVVVPAGRDHLLAVTAGGRLLVWDTRTTQLRTSKNLLLGPLVGLARDGAGGVWVHAQGGVLAHVAGATLDDPEPRTILERGVAHMVGADEGDTVIAALEDGALVRYDAATQTERGRWTAAALAPEATAISALGAGPDSTGVVFDDGTVAILFTDGRPAMTLGGAGPATSRVAVGPGARHIATTDPDRRIRLWAQGRPAPIAILDGHSMTITGLAARGTTGGIVTAAQDGTVIAWEGTELDPGAPLRIGPGGSLAGVRCLSVSADGRYAFCISSSPDKPGSARLSALELDRRKVVWGRDLDAAILTNGLLACTETEVLTLQGNGRVGAFGVTDGAFVREIGLGAEGGRGATNALARAESAPVLVRAFGLATEKAYVLRAIDLITGDERELPGRTEDMAMCVAVSKSGRYAAMGTISGRVGLWNVAEGRFLRWISLPARGAFAVAFTPDETRLLAGGSEICVYGVDSPELLQRWDGHASNISNLAFDPSGSRLYSTAYDGSVRVWHLDERGPLQRVTARDACSALGMSADGSSLYVGTAGGTVEVRDAKDGGLRFVIAREGSKPAMPMGAAITHLAPSADGRRLAIADARRRVRVHDLGTRKQIGPVRDSEWPLTGLALSANGAKLLIASSSPVADTNAPSVIEAARRRPVHVYAVDDPALPPILLAGHVTRPTALTLLPDGRVAYGVDGGRIHVREPTPKAAFQPLSAHSRGVSHLFAVPDSELLLSAAEGHSALLWDLSTGRVRTRLHGTGPFAADRGGGWLVHSIRTRTWQFGSPTHARVWSPRADQRGFVLGGYDGRIGGLAMAPDGATLWMTAGLGFWGGDAELRRFHLDWWRQDPTARRANLEQHAGMRLEGLAPVPLPSSHFTELTPGAFGR